MPTTYSVSYLCFLCIELHKNPYSPLYYMSVFLLVLSFCVAFVMTYKAYSGTEVVSHLGLNFMFYVFLLVTFKDYDDCVENLLK